MTTGTRPRLRFAPSPTGALHIGNANPRAYTGEIGPGRPIQHLDAATQKAILAAADTGAVERLISTSDTLGFPLTPIGEVTDQEGRFTLRATGLEQELPVYSSDEITRVLGGRAPA